MRVLGKKKHEKFHVDSILRTAFLVQICHRSKLLTLFIHKMTLLVAMLALPGCVYMMESVFFLIVEAFGAIPSVKGFISFSVRNVELIFKNWFTLNMPRPSRFIDPRMKFGKQECGSLRHITLNPR